MTAQVTLAGLDVLDGALELPLSGVWTADLELGGDALALGAAELQVIGDGEATTTFRGAVARVALIEGRIRALVVGGMTGGLSASPLGVDVAALHYDGDPTPVSAAEVLGDLCELAGEALDVATLAPLADFTAPSWLRMAGGAYVALARALKRWDLSARFLPAGGLWAGSDTWPVLASKVDPVDPLDDGWAFYVAPRGGSVQPGVTYQDRQILRVTYDFGEALRARLWYREEP